MTLGGSRDQVTKYIRSLTLSLPLSFRPDYKKLSVLKTLFPNVPILAVVSTWYNPSYPFLIDSFITHCDAVPKTATLSQKVLPDLLKILSLPPITDGAGMSIYIENRFEITASYFLPM